jgi:hypothetical protein
MEMTAPDVGSGGWSEGGDTERDVGGGAVHARCSGSLL